MRTLHLEPFDGPGVPWLVCLDMQRNAARAADAATSRPVLLTGQWLLSQARRGRWPVAHLHRRNPEFSDQEGLGEVGPIAGFEPLPSEPLFVRTGLSAFSSQRFCEWAGGAADGQVIFLGLGTCATWLATALSGPDLGIRPGLVEDAVWVSPLDAFPPDSARNTLLAVTAPFAHWTTAAALVDRSFDAQRPRAANQP